MNRALPWIAAILAVALSIGLMYHWRTSVPPAEFLPQPAAENAPAQSAEPRILYPVPHVQEIQKTPLPALGDSDAAVERELSTLAGAHSLAEILLFSDFIRRVVATVDNLPRKSVPQRLLPVKSIPGQILVSPGAGATELMPGNSARYAAYVRLAESLDTARLVAFYVRFYSLFQQAYEDLGYPNAYFNDRVIAVIDDLRAAPDVRGPIRLVQPKVTYEFADPALEARSAGQKLLIRIGHENTARIQAKLRELRASLTALTTLPPADLPVK